MASVIVVIGAGHAPEASAAKVQKFKCPGIAVKGTDTTELFVRRSTTVPKLSCDGARRLMRRFVGDGRAAGWTCKKGSIGFKETIGRCYKRGYSITLTDLTPTLVHIYGSSTEQIDYDYESELNWLAHRICVLYNQRDSDSGAYLGPLAAVEAHYDQFRVMFRQVSGGEMPPASDHRSCPPLSGGTDQRSCSQGSPGESYCYPLLYKRVLASHGASAFGAAQEGIRTDFEHGRYSERARLFTRLRDQVIRVRPAAESGIVTFSKFLSMMGIKQRPEVLPEPPIQDPPECSTTGNCGL